MLHRYQLFLPWGIRRFWFGDYGNNGGRAVRTNTRAREHLHQGGYYRGVMRLDLVSGATHAAPVDRAGPQIPEVSAFPSYRSARFESHPHRTAPIERADSQSTAQCPGDRSDSRRWGANCTPE